MRTVVLVACAAIASGACARTGARSDVRADRSAVGDAPSAPSSASVATNASISAASPSSLGTSAVAVAPVAPSVAFERVERRGSYHEHVVYPKLTFADAPSSRDVNLLVAATVRRLRDQFAADVREAAADLADDAAPVDPSSPRPIPFLAVSCSVPWASNDLVSVGCDTYEFIGGAHGTKGFEAMNLELHPTRAVHLRDVLLGTGATQERLRALCDAEMSKDPELAKEGIQPFSLDDGDAPLSFDTFVFSPRGVRFELKDQLPFVVADAVQPEISYAALAPLLVPGGPASRVKLGVAHVSVAAPSTVDDARAAEDG